MRTGLHVVEKYMPQLLEEGCEAVELAKLANRDLHERLQERVRGKRVDEPRHSVFALRCAYHRELLTLPHFKEIAKRSLTSQIGSHPSYFVFLFGQRSRKCTTDR